MSVISFLVYLINLYLLKAQLKHYLIQKDFLSLS